MCSAAADGFAKVEAIVAALLEELGLTDCADLVVNTLPYGEKRRLELGLALASRPSVLLLDEPLAGLSPAEREGVKQLIRKLGKGRTIILVEHDMDAVFELAERITVLHEGRKLAEGTPKEISERSAGQAGLSRRDDGAMTGMTHGATSMIEVERINTYYGDSHVLFDLSMAGARARSGGAARPQRRRQEHHAQNAGRRAASALRHDPLRRRADRGCCRATRSPASACSWCRRSGAFSAD